MNLAETEKEIAGRKAAEYVKDGMILGLGTGSTVSYTLKEIAEKIKKGLRIIGVSTSKSTTFMAQKLGIPLIAIEQVNSIDLTIDGADEIDSNFNGIKGGGGALLIEKIIASISKENLWVVDSKKIVVKLGKFPLPIEVIPFALTTVMRKLEKKGYNPKLRKLNNLNYITDSNNYIVDLTLGIIKDAKCLEMELNMIPGIVDNGLFLNTVDTVIVGKNDNFEILENKFKAKFY